MKINNCAYKIGKEQAEGVLLIACIYLGLGWKINQIQKGFLRGFRKNKEGEDVLGGGGGVRVRVREGWHTATNNSSSHLLEHLEEVRHAQ